MCNDIGEKIVFKTDGSFEMYAKGKLQLKGDYYIMTFYSCDEIVMDIIKDGVKIGGYSISKWQLRPDGTGIESFVFYDRTYTSNKCK
jgi:hypothetical protein